MIDLNFVKLFSDQCENNVRVNCIFMAKLYMMQSIDGRSFKYIHDDGYTYEVHFKLEVTNQHPLLFIVFFNTVNWRLFDEINMYTIEFADA